MDENNRDRHGSEEARRLFDENTAGVGSLGDIVDQHAGDAVFLAPNNRNRGFPDGGESDLIAEMVSPDPPEGWEEADDEYPGFAGNEDDALGEADITGTGASIARGFGSHLPLDLGAKGFQIEDMPAGALQHLPRSGQEGELDDYDDPNVKP